jgi:hypothetical protein
MAKKKFDAALVDAIVAGDHPASAWLTGECAIDTLSADVAVSAIEAARRQQVIGPLIDARDNASTKSVRKAAGAALHRLKSAGVSVEEPRRGASWTARGATLDAPPQPVALFGLPDPNGYFPFLLVAYGQQEACASAGMAGAGQGHIDADHGVLSRSSARDVLHNAKLQQGLHEVPFHVGLHFLQRAFEEGGKGEPEGFGFLLGSVPEGVKNSARLLDPLEGQEQELDTDALHNIEALMDPRQGVYLALNEEQAYGAMGKLGEALNSQLDIDDDGKMRRVRVIIDDTADAYLNEGTRRSWVLALDVVSFLAFRASNEPLRLAARHTALALRAGHEARDIPFIREWISTQLQSIVELYLAQSSNNPSVGLGEEGQTDAGIILTDG